jgi:hypothetical protein
VGEFNGRSGRRVEGGTKPIWNTAIGCQCVLFEPREEAMSTAWRYVFAVLLSSLSCRFVTFDIFVTHQQLPVFMRLHFVSIRGSILTKPTLDNVTTVCDWLFPLTKDFIHL